MVPFTHTPTYVPPSWASMMRFKCPSSSDISWVLLELVKNFTEEEKKGRA